MTVNVTRDEGVVTVLLNQPGKLNAISPTMWRQLRDILNEVRASSDRVLVLTGAGENFCSGADLGDTPDLDALDVVQAASRREMRLERLVVVLLELDARLLDGHVRMELHVLVVQPGLLVAERAEEVDLEGDRLVAAAGGLGRLA